MKNIHVLFTEKPRRYRGGKVSTFTAVASMMPTEFIPNIYITNDEEIKPSDYYLWKGKEIIKANDIEISFHPTVIIDCKKIILTTDQDLIKDGVQAIDDEFLEWFVKNQSCEFVEVEQIKEHINCMSGKELCQLVCDKCSYYKIIIPKEEPCDNCNNDVCCCIVKEEPKQEISVRLQNSLKQFNLTLEEVMSLDVIKLKEIGFGNRSIIELQSLKPKQETPEQHVEFINNNIEEFDKEIELFRQRKSKQETLEEFARLKHRELSTAEIGIIPNFVDGFVEGYKLAQQQNKNKYSEEEVLVLLHKRDAYNFKEHVTLQKWLTPKEWFEQFKKK